LAAAYGPEQETKIFGDQSRPTMTQRPSPGLQTQRRRRHQTRAPADAEKPVGIDIAGLPVTLNGMVWTGKLDGLFGSISAKAGASRSEQPQLDRLLPA
jgi:hypothetical protein